MLEHFREDLVSSHVLFCCEGSAEEVILKMLSESNALLCQKERVVDFTRIRKSKGIEEHPFYLKQDYDPKLIIVRVVDSLSEQFRLSALFREHISIFNVYTRPEIEMLTIINEGHFTEYQKVKSKKKPSDYCRDNLRMRRVKSQGFLEKYWTPNSLLDAIVEYKRVSNFKLEELCLADILVDRYL